jgi:hypothetical protein
MIYTILSNNNIKCLLSNSYNKTILNIYNKTFLYDNETKNFIL